MTRRWLDCCCIVSSVRSSRCEYFRSSSQCCSGAHRLCDCVQSISCRCISGRGWSVFFLHVTLGMSLSECRQRVFDSEAHQEYSWMLRALVMDRAARVKELRTSLQNLRLCSSERELGALTRSTALKTDGGPVFRFYPLFQRLKINVYALNKDLH